ncbi:MAG: hypothetical protein U0Q15_16990 [Kineosporiaceae bacterium]
MTQRVDLTEPAWAAIDPARELTADERAVLEVLVAVIDSREAEGQLDDVRVRGTCRCGCGSVRLTTDGPAVPSEILLDRGAVRPSHLQVTGAGRDPEGRLAVRLHVVDGLLHELEFFAGDGVRVSLPDVRQKLTDVRVLG